MLASGPIVLSLNCSILFTSCFLIAVPVLGNLKKVGPSANFKVVGPPANVRIGSTAPTHEGANVEHEQPSDGFAAPFEAPFTDWLQSNFAKDDEKLHVAQMLSARETFRDEGSEPLSPRELLEKLGYQSEVHNSTSKDGYVTQLVRIINPINRGQHKQYQKLQPVVFYAGQGVSPGLFLIASMSAPAGHHHQPPRPALQRQKFNRNGKYDDVFSNRSLALTLANSGYDVWLVAARGVDRLNRVRLGSHDKRSSTTVAGANGDNHEAHHQGQDSRHDVAEHQHASQRNESFNLDCDYWSFSSDEIVQFEFRNQLELIIEQTGQRSLALVSYSNGAFVSFAFMASKEHCDFAHKHIDTHVALGPAVFVNKFNLILGAATLISHLSPPGWPFVEDHVDMLARGSLIDMCKHKFLRYTACKFILDSYYGRSALFQSKLDIQLFDYINRPGSPRALRQTLQASISDQLRYYDHGPLANLFIYKSIGPPEYELDKVAASKVHLIFGGSDAIADQSSVSRLRNQLGSEERASCSKVEDYNHLDLIVGRNVDRLINEPVLQLLNNRRRQLDLDAVAYPDEEESQSHDQVPTANQASKGHGSKAPPKQEADEYPESQPETGENDATGEHNKAAEGEGEGESEGEGEGSGQGEGHGQEGEVGSLGNSRGISGPPTGIQLNQPHRRPARPKGQKPPDASRPIVGPQKAHASPSPRSYPRPPASSPTRRPALDGPR